VRDEIVDELPAEAEADPADSVHKIFFDVSLPQVPAPQLASPLGGFAAAFFAVFFGFAVACGVSVDAAAGVAFAAATSAVGAGAGEEADVAGIAGAEVDAADVAAIGAGTAEAAGATSVAVAGCGWAPPQATSALAPRAASAAEIFSRDRSGRMVSSFS
jgi:hypothetical protein